MDKNLIKKEINVNLSLKDLIINYINRCGKKFIHSAYGSTKESLTIYFKLPVPGYMDDKELLNKHQSVIYYGNTIKCIDSYCVTNANKDVPYPAKMSNSKAVCNSKDIFITEFLNEVIMDKLWKDWKDMYQDLRSEVILDKIAVLKDKWESILDNRFPTPKINYNSRVLRLDAKEIDSIGF